MSRHGIVTLMVVHFGKRIQEEYIVLINTHGRVWVPHLQSILQGNLETIVKNRAVIATVSPSDIIMDHVILENIEILYIYIYMIYI